jgi:glycosyltransferase 2 family protein
VTKRQILTTLVKVTFLGFLFYFCLQFFITRWESLQLSDRLETLFLPWIITAAIFTLAYYVLGLLIWIMILHNLGSNPDVYVTARTYVFCLLPKYIPGNVAAHGLRTQLATQAGVPVLVSMKSFLLEAIFALGTAAAIFIPGTMYYFPAVIDRLSAWVVVAFALVLIAVAAARRFKLNSINEFRLTAPHRRPTAYVNVVSLYLLFWLVFGIAHWCLANALSFYSVSNLPRLMVAVSAAWALGFISIFAPAGLGVREAVLYFFVNNWMEQKDIILFVTLSRLLMFGVEVVLTVGFVLYGKLAHRAEIAMTK